LLLMSESPPSDPAADLCARLEALGSTLGARELAHSADLVVARRQIEALRGEVAEALERFHAAASSAGAPHLQIELSDARTDDKHLRSVEFNLTRGRYKAVVTAKSRGEVTLVGPFAIGKTEGPCQTFAFDAKAELRAALADFLEAFLEEAASS
jgi:hypothetical protein